MSEASDSTSSLTQSDEQMQQLLRLAICLVVGLALWFTPTPQGLTLAAWHTFAVFAATIVSFVLRPLPMGVSVLIGVLVLAGTGTVATTALDDWLEEMDLKPADITAMTRSEENPATILQYSPTFAPDMSVRETIEDKTFQERVKQSLDSMLHGFGDSTVWLVVAAFFISGAMIHTGLGRRIALLLIESLGRTTLGLGYSLAAAELALAPFIPSNTARGGGVMMPIVESINRVLGSDAKQKPRVAGEYLVLCGAHLNLVTSAMFLTAMAANPLVSKAASDILGVEFGWGMWLKGSILPGLVSLAVLPYLLYLVARPEQLDASQVQSAVRKELTDLGPWSRQQVVMGIVLLMMLVLWATAPIQESFIGAKLHPTWVALSGVVALLVLGVLPYEKITENAAAWDTLIWLGGLVSMAEALKRTEFVDWFAAQVQNNMGTATGITAAVGLAVVYFYSMYGFSMLTGHILAFAGVFLSVASDLQIPPMVMIALVAYFSSLCGCLTNYSTGPVVIYFGLGYVPSLRWFYIGFLISLLHLAIWLGIGLLWWKMLGWW